MAGSSSSSQTTTKTQSSGEPEKKRHSPILYRVGPLDYHPPKYYDCQQKAVLWFSWSSDNPGRRYLKCYRARVGGCTFMCWFERRHDAFVQTLLVDLRNVMWSLKKEKMALNEALGEATARVDSMEKKLVAVKKEEDKVDALKSEKEDLKAEVRKLEVEKTGLKALFVFFVAIVLFMWIGNQ
ncbi:hypothetical protein QOZ80_4BG0360530 [Eleusine coracana subsp. coracana]|nr:hypothetical protein QOZ80_4BG0360530 [Eleusine coracana subsp. coracana]